MSGLLLAAALACAPPVDLQGEDAIAGALEERLARSGVPLGSGDEGCPALQVRIERAGGAIALEGRDAAGRAHRREVHDLALAVALIEGWRSTDLQAPLLELPPPASPPAAARAAPPGGGAHLRIGAAAELGHNEAGGWERGAAVVIGTPFPPLEGRLVLRYAAVDRSMAAAAPTDLWLGELLVGVGWPLRAGRLEVAPGVAVGVGLDGSERARCDAGCERLVRDDAWEVQAVPRVEAGLSLAYLLGAALALEAGVTASLSPFAPEAASPGWAEAAEGGAFALAPMPAARLRAGLGLAWRPR